MRKPDDVTAEAWQELCELAERDPAVHNYLMLYAYDRERVSFATLMVRLAIHQTKALREMTDVAVKATERAPGAFLIPRGTR